MKRTRVGLLIVITTCLLLIAIQPNNVFGGDFCSAEGGLDIKTATWTPFLLYGGEYRIYIWWAKDPEAATDAPFTVHHAGGSDTIRVNQQTGGGYWYPIGTFNFNTGTQGSVMLSNNADGKVIADAVKFVNVNYPEGEIEDIIVDNNDATFVGVWNCSDSLVAYPPSCELNFCSAEGGLDIKTATWTPFLLYGGEYRIYIWWAKDPEAATDAPFTVHHAGGSDTIRVNQQTGGGYWYTIGTFNFNTGTQGSVMLSNNADGKVIADAVKFVNVNYPEGEIEDIIVDNNDAAFVGVWNWQCSPSGVDVETCLHDTGVCVKFPYVEPPGGNTTVDTASPGPDKPGYKIIGLGNSCSTSSYLNISTTASYTASEADPLKVCITYDDSCLPQGKENSESLRIFHCKDNCQDGNGWQNATCSLDTDANEICACVTSLSSFAVGYEVSADVVTLTIPNGGDVLPSGGQYGICWQAPSNAVKFDLSYSLNNGTSWNFIKTVTGLNCTHWEEIPVVTAKKKQCLVKVTGYDSANVLVGADVSDKSFTIEVLRVTSPNGGETLKSGSTWNIRWEDFKTIRPVAKTKLLYSTNGGSTWNLIKTFMGDPGATGATYSWTVPSVSSTKCKVKVILKDASGVNIGTDVSDKVFTIQP